MKLYIIMNIINHVIINNDNNFYNKVECRIVQ